VATEARPAKQAKLLVVEDDVLIRMLLADMLSEIGYTVAARSDAMVQLNYDEIRLLRELKTSERRIVGNKLDVGLERLVNEGYATTLHPNIL